MQRYVFSARLLHWIMAAGFLFMWVSGYVMSELVSEDSPLEESLFKIHITVGITLFLLLILRIAIRIANKPPALPSGLAAWEIKASHLGHLALYLLPVLVILSAWLEIGFGGHQQNYFGLPVPMLVPQTDSLWGINPEELMAELHELFAYLMLAVVAIHIGAVIKHRWSDGHDVLYRMKFGKTKEQPDL